MPMFSKQHYEAIAKLIREHPNEFPDKGVGRLADMFANDNPSFNRGRFLATTEGGTVTKGNPPGIGPGSTEQAYEIGKDHGRAAGSWVIDGNTTEEEARALLKGMEEGDPAIYDHLPAPDLGGQWADSYTSRDLARELELEGEEDAEHLSECLDAYDQGFSEGVEEEVYKSAKGVVT